MPPPSLPAMLAETESATHSNNRCTGRCDPLETTPEQFPLALSAADVHRQRAAVVLGVIRAAAAAAPGLSLSRLADELDTDKSQISRQLKGEAAMRMETLAALLWWPECTEVLLSGLCGLREFDATKRTPDLGAENRRLRSELLDIREKLDRVLGGQP